MSELVDFVEQFQRDQRAMIERACEASLVDAEQRGVLVVRHRNGMALDARLSSKVPWAEVYEVLAGSDAEWLYSDTDSARDQR